MQHRLYLSGLTVTIMLMAAISGFFYAYQVSVIRGLDVIEPQAAIRAMQGINAEVRNVWFAPSFFGSLVASIAMVLVALLVKRRSDAVIYAAVVVIYGAGAFLLTAMWNVPLNQGLAQKVIPSDAMEAAQVWKNYRDPWMLGNTVRMACSFVCLLLLAWIPVRQVKTDG